MSTDPDLKELRRLWEILTFDEKQYLLGVARYVADRAPGDVYQKPRLVVDNTRRVGNP